MAKFKIGKFSKAVAPLAGIGGFFAGFEGSDIQSEITAIVEHPKVPTIANMSAIASSATLWGFVTLAIGGYVAKHIPITYVSTAGRIMERAGSAAAIGCTAALVVRSLHNPDGLSRTYTARNIGGRTSTAGRVSYPINGTRTGQLRPQA